MRIVHLTQSTTAEITGGLEYHVAYLTAALRRLGHEIIVVNTAEFNQGASSAANLPAARQGLFTWLPRRLRFPLDVLWETVTMFVRRFARRRHGSQVAAYVDRLQPDLVHQHSYIGELRACRLLLRKYPLVFTNHTGAYLHLDRWWPTRPLQRLVMRQFTATIGPSRELLPATANSRYIPNGVDTATFHVLSASERTRLKAKHACVDKSTFLCPRRWAPTKGILYLAKALRHLAPGSRQRCVFLFAGNETPGYDQYQQHVRRELARCGCESRVLGNLSPVELAELMNLSVACLFPSLMEATSLACLEAMACGTPVIGTRCGGLAELIRDGENGWLVPMRDEKALAAALESALAVGSARLQRMGQAAAKLVREEYTWESVARQTDEVYHSAASAWTGNGGTVARSPRA